MSTKQPYTPKRNCNLAQVCVIFQWTLFTKGQMVFTGHSVLGIPEWSLAVELIAVL